MPFRPRRLQRRNGSNRASRQRRCTRRTRQSHATSQHDRPRKRPRWLTVAWHSHRRWRAETADRVSGCNEQEMEFCIPHHFGNVYSVATNEDGRPQHGWPGQRIQQTRVTRRPHMMESRHARPTTRHTSPFAPPTHITHHQRRKHILTQQPHGDHGARR